MRGHFRWLDDFTVIEIPLALPSLESGALQCCCYDGPMGRGNILPFARVPNPLLKPEPLHYPIPACGARDRNTKVSQVNFVPLSLQDNAI